MKKTLSIMICAILCAMLLIPITKVSATTWYVETWDENGQIIREEYNSEDYDSYIDFCIEKTNDFNDAVTVYSDNPADDDMLYAYLDEKWASEYSSYTDNYDTGDYSVDYDAIADYEAQQFEKAYKTYNFLSSDAFTPSVISQYSEQFYNITYNLDLNVGDVIANKQNFIKTVLGSYNINRDYNFVFLYLEVDMKDDWGYSQQIYLEPMIFDFISMDVNGVFTNANGHSISVGMSDELYGDLCLSFDGKQYDSIKVKVFSPIELSRAYYPSDEISGGSGTEITETPIETSDDGNNSSEPIDAITDGSVDISDNTPINNDNNIPTSENDEIITDNPVNPNPISTPKDKTEDKPNPTDKTDKKPVNPKPTPTNVPTNDEVKDIPEERPEKNYSVVGTIAVAGIVVATGSFICWQYLWALLFLLKKKRLEFHGIIYRQTNNRFIKTHIVNEAEISYVPGIFERHTNEINTAIDEIMQLEDRTYLPFNTTITVEHINEDGSILTSVVKNEEELYKMASEYGHGKITFENYKAKIFFELEF